MEIYVNLKSLGKNRGALAARPYSIPDGISTLTELLTAIAEKEVAEYNSKKNDSQLIAFLSSEEIKSQASSGKVGFGRLFSDKKAQPGKAVANVLQCWDDGLVKVIMDETELKDRHAPLEIHEGALFTFIRLSFLSGSFW